MYIFMSELAAAAAEFLARMSDKHGGLHMLQQSKS
jgi:hypothetical protein